MLKSKEIKRLKERVETLESKLNSLLSVHESTKSEAKATLSYEEVITEWLCGKETMAR